LTQKSKAFLKAKVYFKGFKKLIRKRAQKIILFDKLQFHPIEIYDIQLDMRHFDLVEDVDMKHLNLNDNTGLYWKNLI